MAAEPFFKTLGRHALVTVPLVLAYVLVVEWLGPWLENRLWVAALALPLTLICWLLWRTLSLGRSALLGGRFLVFLVAYCLLFTVLAGSDILTWKRTLKGYEDVVPRNWLGRILPPRLAEWHYWFAPEAPPAPDLLVVTLPSFAGRRPGEVRRELAAMIGQAIRQEAKGIAFDFYLAKSAEGAEGSLDVDRQIFCPLVERAVAAGVPVFVGYPHQVKKGVVGPSPVSPTLAGCLPASRQGAAAGFLDVDNRLRMVPLFLNRDAELPSFSLRIARVLRGDEPPHPPDDLVRLVPAQGGISRFDGLPSGDDFALFRRKLVVVGSASEVDTYPTPFGDLQGAEIHAWAAHVLRTGHFIRPLPPGWTFPSILGLCYVLTAFLARGGGWRRLLGLTALLSLAVVAVAALAMRFGLVWIDVSYPLVGMWGLVAVFGVANGALRARKPAPSSPSAETPQPVPEAELFDVFLSHNGEDKPMVRRLAVALRERDLRPWLDEDELVPGGFWQEELEQAIDQCRTAAVLTGADGLGPWEVMEMRVCLSQFVEKRKRVIPVLLPGAPARPNLPPFLTLFTWVDLRKGLTGPKLKRLIWGITGKKPGKKKPVR